MGHLRRADRLDQPRARGDRRLLRDEAQACDNRGLTATNLFRDDWADDADEAAPAGYEVKHALLPRGEDIGASLFELPPGKTQAPYHFHHAMEEILIVVSGRPTLRTPGGERQLEEGETVHFPRGPEGAHQLSNRTVEPARYVFVSTRPAAEVVEYPDSGKVMAMALQPSQRGDPRLFTLHRLENEVEYWDGEPPRA